MSRTRFMLVLLLVPLATSAQQVGKVHRVGLIITTSPVSEMAGADPANPVVRAFVHGLRDLGYVEGRNLVLQRRSAEGRFERYRDLVNELVGAGTDVIVTVTSEMALAAKAVTSTGRPDALFISPHGGLLCQSNGSSRSSRRAADLPACTPIGRPWRPGPSCRTV